MRRPDQSSRFDALLRPHVPGLYRLAYRYTGRREDAEDLVQELLTKLYPRTPELEQVEDLKPWLMRSLYNAFIDSVRRHQRSVEAGERTQDELASSPDPRTDVHRTEQHEALSRALARLSPEHRAVVMLHLVEGFSLPELQEILGVELGTLKSRLHRAKAQLRALLGDDMEPNHPNERDTQHEVHTSTR